MNNIDHKILLVEDIKVQQKIAALVLKKLGYDIDVAETGKEALELAQQSHYAIIFMDLGLDDMDGLTVTQCLRKNANNTPIVALTAHSDDALKKSCFEVGMNDFIQKPITSESAKKILAKHNIGNCRRLSPDSITISAD